MYIFFFIYFIIFYDIIYYTLLYYHIFHFIKYYIYYSICYYHIYSKVFTIISIEADLVDVDFWSDWKLWYMPPALIMLTTMVVQNPA